MRIYANFRTETGVLQPQKEVTELSTAIKDLLNRGQSADVRLMDEWFRKPFTWFSETKIGVLVTPNQITAFRLLILVVTVLLMATGTHPNFELVLVLRVFDGYTDVADGIWARLFGHKGYLPWFPWLDKRLEKWLGPANQFGIFFDQASDKISNWVFIWYLVYLMDAQGFTPVLSTALIGYELFHLALAFATMLDGMNLLVRIRDYGKVSTVPRRKSKGIGKAKAWFQAYGSVFVALAFSWMTAREFHGFVWMSMATVIAWGMACSLFPMKAHPDRPGEWQWPAWRVLAIFVLTVICAMNLWPEARPLVQGLGEGILYGGALLGLGSTALQFIPIKVSETQDTRLRIVDASASAQQSPKE